jgi:PBS lyase HEAT-like repeat
VRRTPSRRPRFARWAARGLALSLLTSAAGCANFWDDVTSQKFKEHPFQTMFTTPDPVLVLRDPESTGDERAKAMRRLKQPTMIGGGNALLDEEMQYLTAAALNDKQPLCRLAAIETLGRFQHPQVVPTLIAAYTKLQTDATPTNPDGTPALARSSQIWERAFTPETVTLIQCRTLRSLGETKNPAALPTLLAAVRSEPRKDASEAEKQQARDVRTAAVRALGNFPGDGQVAAALVQTMQSERDIALRDRAQESLVAVTGRDLPADPQVWQRYLEHPESVPPAEPSVIRTVGAWFKP